MRREAAEILERLGVQIDRPASRAGLSMAQQQIVEIAKALSLEARCIVMDEPTAALSAVEVDRLFGVAEKLRSDGAAVLFISHRLEEVFSLCQRVTVLRDGRHVMTRELAGSRPMTSSARWSAASSWSTSPRSRTSAITSSASST